MPFIILFFYLTTPTTTTSPGVFLLPLDIYLLNDIQEVLYISHNLSLSLFLSLYNTYLEQQLMIDNLFSTSNIVMPKAQLDYYKCTQCRKDRQKVCDIHYYLESFLVYYHTPWYILFVACNMASRYVFLGTLSLPRTHFIAFL